MRYKKLHILYFLIHLWILDMSYILSIVPSMEVVCIHILALTYSINILLFRYFKLTMYTSVGLLLLMLQSVNSSVPVAKLSYNELASVVSSGHDYGRISKELSVSGVLAVSGLSQEFSEAVRTLKTVAPFCLDQLNYPQFSLLDGSMRQTFASSSDSSEEYPECIRESSKIIAKYFDKVEILVGKLIDHVAGRSNTGWITKDGRRGNFSYSLYKEHIHVYKPIEGERGDEKYAAPYHTDNGLLLMITNFQEHPLVVRNKNGEDIDMSKVGITCFLHMCKAC